jgi:hypothetical protein
MKSAHVAALLVVLLPRFALADAPSLQVTSLKLLFEKHVITKAEYDSALRDIAATSGTKAATDPNTLVIGKFATTLYGFVETDVIHDSTESFNEVQGNGLVARNETFGGQHGQLQGSLRNSRLGMRVAAPAFHGLRLSGVFEMDFFGNQPALGYPAANGAISENSFYANPAFRARHLFLKMETPILDVLIGQTWNLFGWQPYFHPNTVEIQGMPGQLYARRPQLRVSKRVQTRTINFEAAVAALNPVQRASEAPEMQAGVRLAFNGWKGKRTAGSTGTEIAPASFGVSGDLKYVKIPALAAPNNTTDAVGTSVAVDVFVPIIPAKDDGHSGNDLSLTGELSSGYGMSDQLTGLTGGVGFPSGYTPDIDSGVVAFDPAGALQYVKWTAGIVGLQYYLPGVGGRVWITANYSHLESPNAGELAASAKARSKLDWINGDLFADIVTGVRVGVAFSRTYDTYADKQQAINDRVQGSAFFIF